MYGTNCLFFFKVRSQTRAVLTPCMAPHEVPLESQDEKKKHSAKTICPEILQSGFSWITVLQIHNYQGDLTKIITSYFPFEQMQSI